MVKADELARRQAFRKISARYSTFYGCVVVFLLYVVGGFSFSQFHRTLVNNSAKLRFHDLRAEAILKKEEK
jgi:hypothetical protein